MKSLDTNIILRIMLQDVPEQYQKIIDLVDSSKPGGLAVADAVFFECAWVLSGGTYQMNRELIGGLILQVANIPQINCNRTMLERAVPLYVEHTQISFIDACLSVYADLNDATPLITFDRKLASAIPRLTESM